MSVQNLVLTHLEKHSNKNTESFVSFSESRSRNRVNIAQISLLISLQRDRTTLFRWPGAAVLCQDPGIMWG